MRQPPKPKSIEDYGGLEPYLDATRADHKNRGYAEFLELEADPKVTKVAMASLMGLNNTTTLYKWLAQLEKERDHVK